MTSQSNLYISDDFRPERTKNFTLLIQLRPNDFSFAVVYQNELKAWGKNFALNNIVTPGELAPYLNAAYNKVVIGIESPVFTIVPDQLYKDGIDLDISRFLYVEAGEKVYRQKLDEENLVFFKDNNQIIPQLTARYQYYQICFCYKGWLKAIAGNDANWQNFHIDVQHDTVHLLYFKNNKLRYYNSFAYQNTEELVYFVALATNELQLTPVNVKLMLSGDVAANDDTVKGLSQFFPKLEINPGTLVGGLPEHVAPQHLLSITALILCE